MPRRRLFDDVLPAPKSKPAEEFDPFASKALDSNRSSFSSSMAPPVRQLQRNSPSPAKPITPPGKQPPAVASTTGKCRRMNPPQTDNPATFPALNGGRAGLFTHHAEVHARSSSAPPEPDEPNTPSKGNNKTRHLSTDSDDETYGWTDDLEQNIFEVMDTIENPPFSPLFV